MEIAFGRDFRPHEAAANDQTRPVLTGVYVDPKGILVASDGFILAAVPCELRGTVPKDFDGCIIPANIVKAATGQKGGIAIPFSIEVDLDAKRATARDRNGDSVSGDLIDGSYPRWRALIPAPKTLGKSERLVHTVGLEVKLAKAIGAEALVLLPGKQPSSPTVVVPLDSSLASFGIIMPLFIKSDPVAKAKRLLRLARGASKLTVDGPAKAYSGVVTRTPKAVAA